LVRQSAYTYVAVILSFNCIIVDSIVYVTQLSGQRFNINVPHRFAVHNFMRFTFCDHCGSLIYGIMRQGLQCEGRSQLAVFACFTFSLKIVLFTLTGTKYVCNGYS